MKFLALVLLVGGLSVITVPAVAADDEFFYRLGGGVPIGTGPTNRASTLRLGTGLSWNADLTCGNFDINTSITNQLNGVSGAFQNLMGNVIQTASGVVASLPALIIQRLNPALYDLLQNGVLQASEEFHLAEASCEAIVDQMSTTIGSEGWDGLARSGFWRQQAQVGTADILDVKDGAETAGLDAGVPWVAGAQAGGAGQPPIEVTEDATVAGMNLILGRAPDDVSAVSAGVCAGARICTAWTSPVIAAGWVTDVVGDTEIQTCQGCNKMVTRAGMGLQRKYEQERLVIETAMSPMVFSNTAPNQATLDTLEGGEGFRITRQIIEAIREEEYPDAVIQRLSGELALTRTMERALMARRSLLAGMKEPNIANNEMAQDQLQSAVDELDGEIENMVFEMEVRNLLTSNTTVQLLDRVRLRRHAPIIEPLPSTTIREGATN